MNNFRPANIASAYVSGVIKDETKKVGDVEIDFKRILESLHTYIQGKIGSRPRLTMESLTESTYSLKSANVNTMAAFDSVVIEDTTAMWRNGKLCCEFNWKYVEKSGKVIKGDTLCRVELTADGTIVAQS